LHRFTILLTIKDATTEGMKAEGKQMKNFYLPQITADGIFF
jgi:hypothetical protein